MKFRTGNSFQIYWVIFALLDVKTSSFQLKSDSFKSHQSRGSGASVYMGLTLEIAVLVSFWLRWIGIMDSELDTLVALGVSW